MRFLLGLPPSILHVDLHLKLHLLSSSNLDQKELINSK